MTLKVEYNGLSLVIDQPTAVHDAPQFFFDRTYLHDCPRHSNIYCMDGIGRESMSNPKVQTTDGSMQDLELMIFRCVNSK